MPGKQPTNTKKVATQAAAPYNKEASKFEARPKNFGIGADVPYSRDISRFMRWPVFVTRQRKKRVLQRRLKIPPALHQFQKVLDRSTRNEVLKLLKKYSPETRKQRRERVKKAAEAKAKDSKKTVSTKAPTAILSGIQEVTRAVEKKEAKLVVIANNVDPIELVMWLPSLCKANKVPYAIVKDKARLGEAVNMKTVTAVAITEVNAEDESTLKNVVRSVNQRFMNRASAIARQWGGLKLSLRSRAALRKKYAANKASMAME